MRAPITPVLASKRSAAGPVGANFGGVGSSETSAILIIGLSMSPPPSRISIESHRHIASSSLYGLVFGGNLIFLFCIISSKIVHPLGSPLLHRFTLM
jgi:hypothetical protein